MVGEHSGVAFLLLILSISGGFRLALTQTHSLPNNITQAVGTNVVIQCTADAISSSSNPPSWIKDRRRNIIYNAQTQKNLDSNKYLIGDAGNNTLTVMNVQLTDATTYCCIIGLDDYCCNVVVIDSVTASVDPSSGLAVGDDVIFTCTLSYNAPPMDTDSPFPLSDDQDPQLTMYIGQTQVAEELTGEQIVVTGTVPHSKALSYNRTVASDDVGKNVTCVVSSAKPQLKRSSGTPIPVNVPTRRAVIRYPNGSKSPNNVYPLNSTFKCVGDGFPAPTVDWLDGYNNKSLGKRNTGSTIWTAAKQGTYKLVCSAQNTLSKNTTYNYTDVIVNGEVTGQQNSGAGEFRPTDNETRSLRNVTRSLGSNVVIECRSESMNFTNQLNSWFKYDHGKIPIYNASTSNNSNSSKYLVDTGNNTLTVMNVQLNDAVTYCCNVGGMVDYCSNVVIFGDVMPYVRPSNLVEIGDIVNLNCTLIYNAPTSDRDSPFPLSRDQEPKLSMFTGDVERFEAQFVDDVTVPHKKTMSINKTIEVADLDQQLECRVTSTQPYWYTATLTNIASLGIAINYPRYPRILQSGYYVNDVFECISERFPFLEVTWTDVTKQSTPRNISTGIGNATAKVLTAGNYVWMCSIPSPRKRTTISQKITFTARDLFDLKGNKGSVDVRVSLPVLFTSGCVLFIASTVLRV